MTKEDLRLILSDRQNKLTFGGVLDLRDDMLRMIDGFAAREAHTARQITDLQERNTDLVTENRGLKARNAQLREALEASLLRLDERVTRLEDRQLEDNE